MSLNVLKDDARARVRLVATDDTWRQNGSVLLDISQSDVPDVDQRLSVTGSERVKHATGTDTIGFFLLLRADVN